MTNSVETLFALGRRARHAASRDELAFMAVNDSIVLAPYRQAALWLARGGVRALSGVVQIEANAPYVHWLERVGNELAAAREPVRVFAGELPDGVGSEWSDWLPAHGLWLPCGRDSSAAGCLFARDEPWQDEEIAALAEWLDLWCHAWNALERPSQLSLPEWRNWVQVRFALVEGVKWWQQRRVQWLLGVLLVLLFPVRLTVLSPGELVPANPAAIRAPLDGVVGRFHVKPNERVQNDQPLFSFDDAVLSSRAEVAAQTLATAEAEYRQAAHMAMTDGRLKAQLAILLGKINERRAESDYLQGQIARAQVLAPVDGIALFDDPNEWIGKPVSTGERIMRVAAPDDIEVEAWLALGDAIPLAPESPVSLYLSAAPLSSVAARVRYVAHDAVLRPDGSYAYRVRARLDERVDHRIGLKGTAKLNGGHVPLIYWVLRRPWAAIRQFTGF